jgi:hypothetical protein
LKQKVNLNKSKFAKKTQKFEIFTNKNCGQNYQTFNVVSKEIFPSVSQVFETIFE